MVIIKFLMPLDDHTIKKLLLIFWEIVPKTGQDGKLLQEMILVCDAYRKVRVFITRRYYNCAFKIYSKCFFSTTVAMQCLFQSSPWWFVDYWYYCTITLCGDIIHSSSKNLLVISHFNLKTHGARSFSVAALTPWNTLPSNIMYSSSVFVVLVKRFWTLGMLALYKYIF